MGLPQKGAFFPFNGCRATIKTIQNTEKGYCDEFAEYAD